MDWAVRRRWLAADGVPVMEILPLARFTAALAAATDWETNADKAAQAQARREAVRDQMKQRGELRRRDRIDVD